MWYIIVTDLHKAISSMLSWAPIEPEDDFENYPCSCIPFCIIYDTQMALEEF